MRIRRRPQGQSLSSLLPSDPPVPQPPPNASPINHHLELHAEDKREELHPNAATAADLRDEAATTLLPLSPEGNVGGCSRGLGAQRGPAADDDGHMRLENGYQHRPDEPVTKAGESLASGVSPAMPVTAVAARVQKKEEIIKDDSGSGASGIKKRRGPAVLLEGSRCSRVNGRGWRCSQPTLVGYALCEHHLGKGRMRSAAAAAGRTAPGQKLGRTEHQKNAPAVAVAAVTAAPKADVPRY